MMGVTVREWKGAHGVWDVWKTGEPNLMIQTHFRRKAMVRAEQKKGERNGEMTSKFRAGVSTRRGCPGRNEEPGRGTGDVGELMSSDWLS